MIHPHTNLKYQVVITADGFDQKTDPWDVVVRNQFHRVSLDINPDDCIRDTEGNFYFTFVDAPLGKYYATTTVNIPDDDYEDGYMVITDRQHLEDVGICSCHKTPCQCACVTDGVRVTFKRVFTQNLDGNEYLADMDGNFILTSDGKRIAFKKS